MGCHRSGVPGTAVGGRACVALSRHLIGCVIVSRDGIYEALAHHPHASGDRPLGAADAEWGGWQAHHQLWTELERQALIIRP
jgi:hypothetical protein